MYEELKDMLRKELKEITKKGELTAGSLDVIDKLTHSLKSLSAIEGSSYDSYGSSYARMGRDGDGDGRYNERGSYRDSYMSRGSYGKEMMAQKLEALMDEARDEHERRAIRDALEKLN